MTRFDHVTRRRTARAAYVVIAWALLLAPRLSLAQKAATVPDADPEEERKALKLPEGFEVNLWASDPLLAKPTQMNWDPQGRLWVSSSEVYPQIAPGQTANDKILILEDTTGAGKADKVTVFADGLLIPTGVVPGDGGAYVADSTELVHLSDTDGDGKADHRRVLLSGFGTEDTHHIIHTFRWGNDGMLYFNQSIYIHSHIETPWGVRRLNAGGIWQFRPESMQLSVLMRGLVNGWGHHFDRYGQSFATDGAGGEGINYVFPGAAYTANQGVPRIVKGLNPGSPKYCGLEILSGRHVPEDYRGDLITNDFRAHRVVRFKLSDDGAGYSSKQMPDFITTSHPAFRPIDVKMGPDGAIYIADWYNPIIQHGEVDFRDPRRDHTHGRIWRITATGRPLVDRPQLVGASTRQLLEQLKAPEDYTRLQAKRVLKERGAKDVLPVLDAWWPEINARAEGSEHLLLEALWTYQSLDRANQPLLEKVLAARQPEVRAAGVRVIGQWIDKLPDAYALLKPLVQDDHPRVRLEAVRGLALVENPAAIETALQALDKPMDKNLDYALWLTARDSQDRWLPGLRTGETRLGRDPKHLTFALKAVGTRDAVGPMMTLLREGKLDQDREEELLLTVAALGGPRELGEIFNLALAASTPLRTSRLLTALVKASSQHKQRPAGDLTRLAPLFDASDDGVRIATLQAAGAWKVEPLRSQLVGIAKDVKKLTPTRVAAIEGLAMLGGGETQPALVALTQEDAALEIRLAATTGLIAVDLPTAAERAASVLAASKTDEQAAQIINAFLQRKGGVAALSVALDQAALPSDAAKLAIRALRNSAAVEPALTAAITKSGKLAAAAGAMSAEDVKQLLAKVASDGNAARGEAIFRRQEASCLKCHSIGGAGGQVGPDLISVGASAQVDYLLESILQPSAKIKEGYQTLVVTTDEGKVLSGIKLRQTDKDLILRSIDDVELALPLASIESQANGASLMPVGLADALTTAELTDLVRFLSELGKVGPYSVGKAAVVRRWQAQTVTGWTPVYSQVSGVLPVDELPQSKADGGAASSSVVRAQLEATTGGNVKLLVNDPAGLSFSLDGKPLEAKAEMTIELSSGVHTLTTTIDRAARQAALRIELQDIVGSPARARVVGGK